MWLAQPVLVLLAILVTVPAFAQADVRTAPVEATGGAAAAHAHDNSALTVNPAAMGLQGRYALSAVGGFWNGSDWRAGINAVDGLTNKEVAIGVAYQRWRTSAELTIDELPGWIAQGETISKRRRYDNITIGAAVPMADHRFSFGINGTLLVISHAVLGNALSGDLDVGIAGRPAERWSVGVAARNMLPQFFATDERIGIIAGTRYAWNEHTALALDVDVPLTAVDGLPVAIRGGAEWGDVTRHFGIGYRWEGPTEQHWVTLGAGLWSDPETSPDGASRAGINYAAQIPLHKRDSDVNALLAVQHTLTITVVPKLATRE